MKIRVFSRKVFLKGFTVGLLIFCVFSAAATLLAHGPHDVVVPPEDIHWGVTFSQPYAVALALDWQEAYRAILEDLGVDHMRLIAYWPAIEPEENRFNFADLDWQIDEAAKRNVKVVLAIGQRLPRWPECHIPEWAKKLSKKEREKAVLTMLSEVVRHYAGRPHIKIWQVENEPFLKFFGICEATDKDFFYKEIELVRKLDPPRQILVTDSGELSAWIITARYGDILGTTMYRVVPKIITFLGYSKYPFPPWFYRKKANLVNRITPVKKLIVAELQAEAWSGKKFIAETSLAAQYRSMSMKQFRQNISYARASGIGEIYLWGAEWWYWLKEKHGVSDFWEEAKNLWQR